MNADMMVDSVAGEINSVDEVLMLVTGELPGAIRAAGLFTRDDLFNIKNYVREGLALPFELAEVIAYIGYARAEVVGLEPEDIASLFSAIRQHAATWSAVEAGSLQQGQDLAGCAEKIQIMGAAIIANIEAMPILDRVRQEWGGIKDQPLEDFKYSDADHEIAGSMGELLNDIGDDIQEQQARTAGLKRLVSDFRLGFTGGHLSTGELVQGLDPQIGLKQKKMLDAGIALVTQELKKEIEEKNGRIDQLRKDYNQYVLLAFSGAIGVIPLLVTGGIFGSKAEDVRKRRNALVEEVRGLESRVKDKKNLQKVMDDTQLVFRDMHIRMLDAEESVRHLDYMWQQVATQISSSKRSFERIADAQKLTSFLAHFKSVISPWKKIGESSDYLITVLDEALKSYRDSL